MTAPDPVLDEDAEPTLGTTALLSLGLLWFAAMLWSTHASIAAAGDPADVVTSAALNLRVVVGAGLVAGVGAGLAAAQRFAADAGWRKRVPLGLAGGLACGAFAAALILVAYGWHGSIATLAATVGGAAVLGGALGSLRPAVVVGAGLAATLSVFVVDVVIKLFESRLVHLFGARESEASKVAAAGWFSFTLAAASALAAGLIAWGYLRRRTSVLQWPAYLAAGAGAGVVLLLADGMTRLGGARLLAAAGGLSESDAAVQEYTAQTALNHELVVAFFGAVVALIAFGRTLPRRPAAGEPEPASAGRASEPASAEPVSAEPVSAEPVSAEPVSAEPVE